MKPFILVLSVVFAGCAVDAVEPETSSSSSESAVVTSAIAGARVVPSSNGARRLELLGPTGAVVASYYPGFFTASLLVPDVAGNTNGIVTARVGGTDILASAFNPRTGVVAVAVRGFIYAETSTDMVFAFNTRSEAFARNRYASPTFLPFDGRRADGTIATNADATRPFLDIKAAGLSYDPAGRLLVLLADASGGTATVRYAPDLRAVGCVWAGGESRRCPAP